MPDGSRRAQRLFENDHPVAHLHGPATPLDTAPFRYTTTPAASGTSRLATAIRQRVFTAAVFYPTILYGPRLGADDNATLSPQMTRSAAIADAPSGARRCRSAWGTATAGHVPARRMPDHPAVAVFVSTPPRQS